MYICVYYISVSACPTGTAGVLEMVCDVCRRFRRNCDCNKQRDTRGASARYRDRQTQKNAHIQREMGVTRLCVDAVLPLLINKEKNESEEYLEG
jgi:hypothetical protein